MPRAGGQLQHKPQGAGRGLRPRPRWTVCVSGADTVCTVEAEERRGLGMEPTS